MNTKGKASKKTRRSALTPLSGKIRPDRDDIEILLRDREGLELIVAAILANGRLATLVAHAWAEERSLYLLPMEEWKRAKAGVYSV